VAQNNVIELVLKLRDGISAPLQKVTGKLGGLGAQVAVLAGVATVGAALTKVIRNSIEAEQAVFKLDQAYRVFGKTVGVTREDILSFSAATQRVSIFGDESLTRAQASLLRFSSVTGETFKRARQAAVDLASALGTDLEAAAFTVGRSLERPTQALRQLRQFGILFTASQEEVIKKLEQTGQRGKAAEIILRELEKRFGGAASAARNTLGGALTALNNAFGDLFEATAKGTEGATKAVNDLTAALQDKQTVEGLQAIAGLLLTIIGRAAQAVALLARAFQQSFKPDDELDRLFTKQSNLGASLENATRTRASPEFIERIRGEIDKVQGEIRALQARRRIESGRPRRGGRAGPDTSAPGDVAGTGEDDDLSLGASAAAPFVQRGISGTAIGLEFEANTRFLEEFSAAQALSRTETQRLVAAYEELESALQRNVAAGFTTATEASARLNEELDKLLPGVESTVKRVDVPISGVRERFNKAAENIGNAIGNAISQGGLNGLTSLREILKQSLRNMLADVVGSGLKNALKDLFSGVFEKNSSGGGGFLGGLVRGLGSLFGAAGGGIISRATIVGEDGPELAIPVGSTRIYNKRQMGALGGGATTLTVAPVTNINIDGDVSERNQAFVIAAVEQGNARTTREVMQMLQRNGLRRPI
jgi:tetratricopeptide (TPR) repeat protein